MATQNSINKKSQDLTIDPGAAGDSFVQFDINTTGEFRIGVDDDAADAFKISQGSALGTTDTFVVTAAGEITKPLQSAFLAVLSSDITDVTGDGTTYTVVWDTEVFDQNSDFDGTSTFTSPVTARYRFDTGARLEDIAAAHNNLDYQIATSNRTYRPIGMNPGLVKDSGNAMVSCATLLCDMDAADTCQIRILVTGSTKVINIGSVSAADPRSWFSGNLEC